MGLYNAILTREVGSSYEWMSRERNSNFKRWHWVRENTLSTLDDNFYTITFQKEWLEFYFQLYFYFSPLTTNDTRFSNFLTTTFMQAEIETYCQQLSRLMEAVEQIYPICMKLFHSKKVSINKFLILAEILFNIYKNDLIEILLSDSLTRVALFADDLGIWSAFAKYEQTKLGPKFCTWET